MQYLRLVGIGFHRHVDHTRVSSATIWGQIRVVSGPADFQLLIGEYLTLSVLYLLRPEIDNRCIV